MNITELCVKCKQNNSCTMCWKTSNKKCPYFIQKTNADRIRAMSDEELSELLNQWGTSTRAWQKDKGETMYWLQQPAEEDENGV